MSPEYCSKGLLRRPTALAQYLRPILEVAWKKTKEERMERHMLPKVPYLYFGNLHLEGEKKRSIGTAPKFCFLLRYVLL